MGLAFVVPSLRNIKSSGLVLQSTQNWFSLTHNPFGLIFKKRWLRRSWTKQVLLWKGNTQCVQPQILWSPQGMGGCRLFFGGGREVGEDGMGWPAALWSTPTPTPVNNALDKRNAAALGNLLSAKPCKNHLLYKAQALYKRRVGSQCWALGPQDILSPCPNVYIIPLTPAALGHPSVRTVLQMPPLNLGTVSLFARRDPRNQTAGTIVSGRRVGTKERWEMYCAALRGH